MFVLAIDTALECCATAVLDTQADSLVAQESLPMARGHAEALMPQIARVMADAGISFGDLDRIAVTVGPGSFTGLRVGIAAARGIALAAAKPVIGVTTLAAYAAPLLNGENGEPVATVIDARHDNVYFQVMSSSGAMLVRPALVTIDDTFPASRFGALRLVGNAARVLADRWLSNIAAPALVDAKPAPDIFSVATLGAAADAAISPARPFYLRAPDAKPQAELRDRRPNPPPP